MTKKNPDISIIIPTWNTADITLKCIETISLHFPPTYAEIIVVDNASTDNTATLLSKIPQIKIISNRSNFGFSKACNLGAAQSHGDFLFFLNSDMELIDDSLKEMLLFLVEHKEVGLIGPMFLNNDHTPQGSIFPPQTAFNAFCEFWLHKNCYSKYYLDSASPSSVWALSGGAILISRHIYDAIGGFNEKYFMYYEDLELCRSVRKINKTIYYFPQCRVVHHHGASGKSLINKKNQWRRLIPGSIKYHGIIKHSLINFIIWSSQKYYQLIHAFN